MSWTVLLWFVLGWGLSALFFYVLKQANPDKGVCLRESTLTMKDQLLAGRASNFSNLHGECFFHQKYEDARRAFEEAATRAGAELTENHIDNVHRVHCQVAAVLRGNPEKVLLHLSGVHGVEGYAGSSAQIAALNYLDATGLYRGAKKSKDLPTLIFIFAVNSYGFYHNRRTDEENIDLNRNFLTDEEFEFVRKRDPNYSRYVDLDEILNPTKMPFSHPYLNDLYWYYVAATSMLKHGFVTIKRAMVAGNYHKRKGYGFGGFQRAGSVNALIKFLYGQKVHEKAKLFYVVDVHTGLGPTGVDTLMFDNVDGTEWVESLYPTEVDRSGGVIGGIKTFSFGSTSPLDKDKKDKAEKTKKSTSKEADAVGSGYDLTVGMTSALCDTFIAPHLNGKNKLCVTQEFGTAPAFMVGKGAIEENYAHFYGTEEEKKFYAARYRPLFYVETRDWKRRVAARGLLVFLQTLDYLTKTRVESKSSIHDNN